MIENLEFYKEALQTIKKLKKIEIERLQKKHKSNFGLLIHVDNKYTDLIIGLENIIKNIESGE